MSTMYTDRYGLPLSTSVPEAAAHYVEGTDRALALTMGAQASLETALHVTDFLGNDERFTYYHGWVALRV